MQELITGQLFPLVLSLSLSGTLTGILVAAIHPFTRNHFSKKWNYYIWLLVVAQLLMPFHFESSLLKPLDFHVAANQTDKTARPDHMVQNDIRTLHDSGLEPARQNTPAAHIIDLTQPKAHTPDTNLHEATFSEEKPSALYNAAFSMADIWAAAAYIWLFGAFCTLLIRLFAYCRYQNRLKRDCTRITDDQVIALESALCARLRIQKPPVLYESASAYSPMVIGLRKPAVILPEAVFSSSHAADSRTLTIHNQPGSRDHNTNRLRLILRHELIHIARKDLWYKWIYQLLLCIHWFNPVLYFIGRQISDDCELSCDEAILPELTDNEKQMYGNLLLDAAEQGIAGRQNAFSTALMENKRNLKRRLDAILHRAKRTRPRLLLSTGTLIIMLLFSACSNIRIAGNDSDLDLDSKPDAASDRPEQDVLPSDGDGLLADVFSSDEMDAWLADFTKADTHGTGWNIYDDDSLIAGSDAPENWYSYLYSASRNIADGKVITASVTVLYGSGTVLIAYADRDTEVSVTSAFDILDGKFKFVHIAPDGSVTTLNDSGAESNQTITMKSGRNVIKMVGQGAKVKKLALTVTGMNESDFAKIYDSEREEDLAQIMDGLKTGTPPDKDKVVRHLYDLTDDRKAVSDIFHELLISRAEFTTDEYCDFFRCSDRELSSRYLVEALEDGYREPPDAEAASIIMRYIDADYRTRLLTQLPTDIFYPIFEENRPYLTDDQIRECLTDYMQKGGSF